MVVRGGEETQIAERVESDGIIRSAITKSTGISRDSSVVDVVVGLGTQQESVTSENNVAGDVRSLLRKMDSSISKVSRVVTIEIVRRTLKRSRLVLA